MVSQKYLRTNKQTSKIKHTCVHTYMYKYIPTYAHIIVYAHVYLLIRITLKNSLLLRAKSSSGCVRLFFSFEKGGCYWLQLNSVPRICQVSPSVTGLWTSYDRFYLISLIFWLIPKFQFIRCLLVCSPWLYWILPIGYHLFSKSVLMDGLPGIFIYMIMTS